MSIRTTIMTFLSLFIIIISAESCKKGCKACDYGTQCNSSAGYCFCPNGLEGDSCHTYSFSKYVHSYSVLDPCSTYGNNYSVSIQPDPSSPNESRLYIYGLFGAQIEADILSDANKKGVNLNIPLQTQGAFSVEGSGIYQSINNGYAKITLQLEYTSGGVGSNCTVILNQQ